MVTEKMITSLAEFRKSLNEQKVQENILRKGIDALNKWAGKVSAQWQKFFTSKDVTVKETPDATIGEFKRNGKVIATVYDFTKGKGANTDFESEDALEEMEEVLQEQKRSALRRKQVVKRMLEAKVGLDRTNERIPNVNKAQLLVAIEMSLETLNPLMIWGAAGIGKTSIVNDFAKEQAKKDPRFGLVKLPTSEMEPTDFVGLPYIDQETKRSSFALAAFWPTTNGGDPADPEDGPGGIIFMDEINLASPPVFKAIQRLTSPDRALGDFYKLPSKWVVVAAGNRAVEAEVTPMNIPQSNRFKHVNYVPKFEEWAAWGEASKVKIGKEELQKIAPEVITFLIFKKGLFHSTDTNKIEDGSPFPTPRTWEQATKEYYVAKKNKGRELSRKEIEEIFASHIGEPEAIEFANFVDIIKSYPVEDIEKVYKTPEKAALLPKKGGEYDPDKAYAIVTAIAEARKKNSIKLEEFENLIKYAVLLNTPEYATLLIRLVRNNNENIFSFPNIKGIVKPWYDKYKIDAKDLEF